MPWGGERGAGVSLLCPHTAPQALPPSLPQPPSIAPQPARMAGAERACT